MSLVVAGLAAWFVLFTVFFSAQQEHGAQARLYDRFRSQLANETAPFQAPIAKGAPVALLTSTQAGLHDAVVVEGTTSSELRSGPGHQANTPLPGQVGTAVVMGRKLAYGGPFSGISSLRPGDTITATTAQGVFTYRVTDTRHSGDPIKAIPVNQGRLTLVTSTEGWLGPLTPAKTLYVDAMIVKGQVQPVPAPLPASVSKASEPMQGDSGAAVPLTFWIEGLVAVGVLVALAWRRWGKWQTWLVGLPVVLSVSWGLTDTLVRFLPNLF